MIETTMTLKLEENLKFTLNSNYLQLKGLLDFDVLNS